ncbi:MAG: hypothetical protein AB7I19_00300 [Planctomycetota bacterium]
MFVWIFVAPLLVVADGWLAERLPWRIDLAAVFVMVAALELRSRSLPMVVLALAFARSVLCGGGVAAQFLALALPVALARPLRVVFDEHAWVLRAFLAPALVAVVPRALEIFAGISGHAVATPRVEFVDLIVAVVTLPPMAWLLARLPPLSVLSLRRRRRRSG